MKLKVQKCTLIKCLTFLICTCVLIVFILLLKKSLPNYIYYSVKQDTVTNTAKVNTTDTPSDEILFRELSGIDTDGPFTVKSSNDGIFVFCGEKKLYRIKTDLSSLPYQDKEKIRSGIVAKSKAELYETVYCLES